MSQAKSKMKSKSTQASAKPKPAWEPRIVSFCCHYCSYGAADLAGTSKMSYPINVEIIRVPCSGRVDPLHVIEALREGADGVMVTGCLKDQCHFVTGNFHAEKRMQKLTKDLEDIGLGGRLIFELMSAGMANKWVETASSFYEHILKLGPNPLRRMKSEVKCE
jgi:coenzyme F420-reducing hydrogenase delta subunit